MSGRDSELVAHNRSRCQAGRALVDGSNRKQGAPCPNRVEPGSMMCALHKAEAMLRVSVVRKDKVS